MRWLAIDQAATQRVLEGHSNNPIAFESNHSMNDNISSETSERPQASPKHHPQNPDNLEYVIWPRRKMSPKKISETDVAIRAILGPEITLNNYISSAEGLVSWWSFMTLAQVEEIKKLEGVSASHKVS